MLDNQEKQRVWQAYHARKPIRVPATLGANARVVLLDEKQNPSGIPFERYYHDPAVTVRIQLKHMEYKTEYLARYCDYPSGRPEEMVFYVDNQNIYDAAYFGSPVHFPAGQVPATTPILEGAHRNDIFDFDLDHPLENPFIQECFRRHAGLCREAAQAHLAGVKISVAPMLLTWDGPSKIRSTS